MSAPFRSPMMEPEKMKLFRALRWLWVHRNDTITIRISVGPAHE